MVNNIKNLFENVADSELKQIYDEIYKGREEGLRPRILDPYISQVLNVYPLGIAGAWKHAEQLFWEEVAKRYFGESRNDQNTD